MLAGLGDRLLARLVPKTAAAACDGAQLQAEWFEPCYCADPGTAYRCQWIGKICGTCGGVTYCSGCEYVSGRCCT